MRIIPKGFIATDLREADDRINDLKEQLAASQAREQVLRALVQECCDCHAEYDNTPHKAALSIPSYDTALRQWGAKLLREYVCDGTEWIDAEEILSAVKRKADELDAPKVYYAGQDPKTPK